MEQEPALTELLACWKLAAQADDALTTRELVEATGRSENWVRLQIKRLLAAGRMTLARKCIKTISDLKTFVPAYQLTPATANKPKGGRRAAQ